MTIFPLLYSTVYSLLFFFEVFVVLSVSLLCPFNACLQEQSECEALNSTVFPLLSFFFFFVFPNFLSLPHLLSPLSRIYPSNECLYITTDVTHLYSLSITLSAPLLFPFTRYTCYFTCQKQVCHLFITKFTVRLLFSPFGLCALSIYLLFLLLLLYLSVISLVSPFISSAFPYFLTFNLSPRLPLLCVPSFMFLFEVVGLCL